MEGGRSAGGRVRITRGSELSGKCFSSLFLLKQNFLKVQARGRRGNGEDLLQCSISWEQKELPKWKENFKRDPSCFASAVRSDCARQNRRRACFQKAPGSPCVGPDEDGRLDSQDADGKTTAGTNVLNHLRVGPLRPLPPDPDQSVSRRVGEPRGCLCRRSRHAAPSHFHLFDIISCLPAVHRLNLKRSQNKGGVAPRQSDRKIKTGTGTFGGRVTQTGFLKMYDEMKDGSDESFCRHRERSTQE